MHFEIIKINNLLRIKQRKSGKCKQLVLANLILNSRHDVIFSETTNQKNVHLKNLETQMQTDLWERQIITDHVTGARGPWLSMSGANVQVSPQAMLV